VGEDVAVAVAVGAAVVVVVVGAAVVGEGVVIPGMVVCCALTVAGESHVARSTNPAAKTARTTIDNFNKARVRSVISSPCASLTYDYYSYYSVSLPALHHKHPRTGRGQRTSRWRPYPLG
jgi:hypothetical protein